MKNDVKQASLKFPADYFNMIFSQVEKWKQNFLAKYPNKKLKPNPPIYY